MLKYLSITGSSLIISSCNTDCEKNPQILAALKDIKLNCILQEEIYRLEKGIESDQKLKHMAELQISVVADPGSKHQIQVAISGE